MNNLVWKWVDWSAYSSLSSTYSSSRICICGSGHHLYTPDSAGMTTRNIFALKYPVIEGLPTICYNILQAEYNVTAFVEAFKIIIHSNPVSLKMILPVVGFCVPETLHLLTDVLVCIIPIDDWLYRWHVGFSSFRSHIE